MWPFKRKDIEKQIEKRNYAVAYQTSPGQPVYNNWTIQKAVRDGYKTSGWVYRSVFLIAKSIASVPWIVIDNEGEPIDAHPLNKLFRYPNPFISRQDLFELIASWLGLAGNSYLKKVQVNGRTVELWPMSPDKTRPITPKTNDELISGYQNDSNKNEVIEPELIIHHKFFNPADIYVGISPLEAAGKVVDLDVSMTDFNVTSAQKRGVLDGVFTFEREFANQDETDAITRKIEEKYGQKRGFLVLGSNAKYQQLSMTPTEMDFVESRKFVRDEILSIFGVPPQLVGVQDASTYDNYNLSQLIFWSSTVLPWLDDICDGFNFSFRNELGENARLTYDLSGVQAIREAQLDRSETAKNLSDMGVPFEQINRLFQFGVDEFDGWDKSISKTQAQPEQRSDEKILNIKSNGLRQSLDFIINDVEQRLTMVETENQRTFKKLLSRQKDVIFKAINEAGTIDSIASLPFHELVGVNSIGWEEAMQKMYLDDAVKAGVKVKIQKRGAEIPFMETRDALDALRNQIALYLIEEGTVLREKSLIDETTVDTLLTKVAQAVEAGFNVNKLQDMIIDSGIFDPVRALRLSRTISGTASSLGQFHGAKLTGATHKKWRSSLSHVRQQHQERDREPAVGINDRFSAKFGMRTGPQFPLDPILVPADRVNCRCSMTFYAED